MLENPEFEVAHRDITAILKDGMQKKVYIDKADGTKELMQTVDERSAWWKTHHVASPRFGRMATILEHFLGIGEDTKNHLNIEWATVLKEQILNIGDHYMKGIDAKSSETMKDKNTSQTSLVDKYLKNKQERVVSLKDDAKRGMFEGMFGSKKEDED